MALQTDLRIIDGSTETAAQPGPPQVHLRCICRFDDGAVFAYAERGHEFIRASDRELWAVERDDALVSARSGTTLAYRRGRVFFAADDNAPLYYERAI
jgi:phage baseplate assembly protein gpV